jgi:Carboxypeptidase regulatory-like domain
MRHLTLLAFVGAAALAACGGSSSGATTATPRVTASATTTTRAATATPSSTPAPLISPTPAQTPPPLPPAQTPPPTSLSGDSGIEGAVTIGPTCPVQRIDSPCPDRPYEATISVLDAGRNRVTETRSDADGLFRVALPPGVYVLAPEAAGGPTRAAEQTVTVVAGRLTAVQIVFDSGIR